MVASVLEAWLSGWVEAHEAPGGSTATSSSSSPSSSTPASSFTSPTSSTLGPAPVASGVRLVGRVGRERARLDADLLLAVREVVADCRAGVLAGHDTDEHELSPGQERVVLRDTKRRAVTETLTVLGLRTTEATTLVALAMAPVAVQDAVLGALDRGETCWAAQARRFWEMTASTARELTEDQQVLVAMALFGTDPALAAVERFDPDGELTEGVPWPQAAFEAALTREVTACEGTDVAAEREKRRRAYHDRRARIRVHDDGTATLVLTGPIHKVLAAHARHDDIARTLRAQGHPDTLAQLAADSMLTILVHGTLDLPLDASSSVDALSEEDLDDLIAVVNGHPRVTMQVVVPADALGLGHPVCATCATNLTGQPPATSEDTADAPPPLGDGEVPPDEARRARPAHPGPVEPESALPPDPAPPDPAPTGPAPTGPAPTGPAPTGPEPRSADPDRPPWGYDPDLRRGRGLVAEIIGSHPVVISPGHAREYFYTPGTTLYRLLTDPADGRCLERTISAYRPDTDLRRQVNAADVYSRHPHSRLTGRSLEIDHVIPFGTVPGGTTTEGNLAALDKRTHKVKTLREIALTIDARRDLTFTTLLGQLTRSRTHDYSQYLRSIHPEDLEDRADLANRLLYAALASRPEHRYRPDRDTWLTLDHTDPATGERRPGPPEHPDEVDRLLGIDDE